MRTAPGFLAGVALVAFAAAVGCGGGSGATSQSSLPGQVTRPNPLGLWAGPLKVAIQADSDEMIAVGAGAINPMPGVAESQSQTGCPVTSPIRVQVSGLPAGVTASPASPVIPANCSGVAVDLTVDGGATPGNYTISFSGSSGNLSATVKMPFEIMPANPMTAAATATCAEPPAPPARTSVNEWTWVGGTDKANQAGVYGTEGKAAAGNMPGSRDWAAAAADRAGNFWLFGGLGQDASSQSLGDLNDLWEYSNGQWAWMGGSDTTEQTGVYGTEDAPAAGNTPGARDEAAGWTDAAGNFWIFGGSGVDSKGQSGGLNDLWKYDPGTREWTWMNGSNVAAQQGIAGAWQGAGTYGTEGVPSAENSPGARSGAVTWTDSCGNLWLFGGMGSDAANGISIGSLNDLWKYDPATNEWTWMSGANFADQNGTYGTMGVAAPGNVPGSREWAVGWVDRQGNLWLFGGIGSDNGALECKGSCGDLDDLWKYDPATNEWTWMGGSEIAGEPANYGTRGVAAAGNIPGSRDSAVSWTDARGNFWLFGGNGVDAAGFSGDLNDLWEYSQGEWKWVSGSDKTTQLGSYGTEGVAAPGNVPVARDVAVGWADPEGNLWLFGGDDSDVPGMGSLSKLNDLWEYQP